MESRFPIQDHLPEIRPRQRLSRRPSRRRLSRFPDSIGSRLVLARCGAKQQTRIAPPGQLALCLSALCGTYRGTIPFSRQRLVARLLIHQRTGGFDDRVDIDSSGVEQLRRAPGVAVELEQPAIRIAH